MNEPDDPIVSPVRGKHPPLLGSLTLMVSSHRDFKDITGHVGDKNTLTRPVVNSRLCLLNNGGSSFSAAGPVVGASYAVLILESLIAWGAENILFYGWCGAISPDVGIGDIIVPTGACIEEGTSRLYMADEDKPALPSDRLMHRVEHAAQELEITCRPGSIWTTDAVFRETRSKVVHYQEKGVLAVEMELSALFTVARFRKVELAGILVVSDDLSSLTWKPGFKDERFRHGREKAVSIIKYLANTRDGYHAE